MSVGTRPIPASGLYAIVDLDALARAGFFDVGAVARALCEGGAVVLQLRAKGASASAFVAAAREVGSAARERGVCFIVNDRVDVAALVEADGVHLGQDDLPVHVARAQLGPRALIGLSTHDLAQVTRAQDSGADYLGFGPVFATATKLNPDPVVGVEGLAQACGASRLPVAAIGGVRLQEVPKLRAAGARWAAVVSDLLSGPTLIERARAFTDAWGAPS